MNFYTHIYTGDGKGKTTAALGLALRASGNGMRSFVGQFMKGSDYSELKSLSEIPGIDLAQFGWPDCIRKDEINDFHHQKTAEGLELCREKAASGDYQLIILDEILVSILFDLIEEKAILDFLEEFNGRMEIILTGRGATPALIAVADLVTEMRCEKHYYDRGIQARKGIEY